jgi:protein-disulfide isomerase
MEEAKKESVQEISKKEKLEKARKNPWIVSTFVLGFLVVILLVSSLSGVGLTGKVVSENKAGENLVQFATSQGVEAELINSTSQGSFYKVYISINNQEIPYFVTKDGKYFLSESYLIPLTVEDTTEPDSTPTTTNIPKTDKPAVELFVMSYCPYGTQAEKGIIPAIELLGDKIDFKLRFVYYAMHPTSGEVEENLREYCIQKGQPDKLIPYLKCFLQEGDSASCLTETGINKVTLNSCVTSADKEFQVSENKDDKTKWLSGNYPLFNVDKTLNEKYDIAGSPTLVINGVQASSARDPASYLSVICSAFTDGNVPEECSQTLSTTAYSAGFGYETSGSTTTAQCG